MSDHLHSHRILEKYVDSAEDVVSGLCWLAENCEEAGEHEAAHLFWGIAERIEEQQNERIERLESARADAFSKASDAEVPVIAWLGARVAEESVANNRLRDAAEKMLDVCFAGHRVIDRAADRPLMDAAKNLKDALDRAEDGSA